MGTVERRHREKNELRGKIMDAARILFATEGYEAVSMRRIANAIEYSPTAIYVHFADKDTLIREMCREDFGALAGNFRALAAVKDPVDRIRRLGVMYVEFGVKYPNHYRLMFMTAKPFTDLQDSDLAIRGQPDEDAYAFLRETVREAVDAGRTLPGIKPNVELMTQTLWAGVHGVVAIELTHSCDQWISLSPLRERVRLMVDISAHGLFTRASAQRHSKPAAKRKASAK